MKKIFALLFIVFFLGSASCLAEEPVLYSNYDRFISFPGEIFNFHVVRPGILRGSQPSEDAFKLLKEYYGVKTILNLRCDKENYDWEKEVVERLGMNFINIPMSGHEEQGVKTIEQCLDIITNKANQPIFVHCHGGKDRTGMVCAAFRMKYDKWTFKQALLEMLVYGYDRNCCSPLERSLIKWDKWRRNIFRHVFGQSEEYN